MSFTGVTTMGVKFYVECKNEEIIFTDQYGDTLTWDDNKENRLLVKSMINVIINKLPGEF